MDKFKLNSVNSDMNVYHYKTVEDILAFLEKKTYVVIWFCLWRRLFHWIFFFGCKIIMRFTTWFRF